MPDWVTPLVTVLAAALGSGGLIVATLERRAGARERRSSQRVAQPAVDFQVVNGASLALVQELQEELSTARAIAPALARLEGQCAELERRLTTMIGWIHTQDMTIDLLRRMVPLPPGTSMGVNGR